MDIILASTSPRRRELLALADLDFTVMSVDIDESFEAGESATDYILRMVNTKAAAACHNIDTALVITADTIGVLPDGEILVKPVDKADAFAMWDKLSGGCHEIWTAVCATLVKAGQIDAQKAMTVVTKVYFVPLTDTQKERYWATGEPKDKAGAYAIQGGAAAWVSRIEGSYTNVVGLPLAETLQLIETMRANV